MAKKDRAVRQLAKEDREDLRRQYELAVNWVQHQDERRWTLLSAFVVVNGLLVATAYMDKATEDTRLTLGWIGVANAVVWLLIMWRNNFYLKFEEDLAADLEHHLLGKDSAFRFWTDSTKRNQALTSWMKEQVTSARIIFVMILATLALWIRYLVALG